MNLQEVGTPSKAKSDNEGTADLGDGPKSMVVSDLHPLNAYIPILVADGIDTDSSEKHDSNAPLLIVVADGSDTDLIKSHSQNVLSPMLFADGRFMEVSEWQYENA